MEDYGIEIAAIVIAGILVYWYSKRNHNYWKKKGIPYAEPCPFVGSHPCLVKNKNFEDVDLERYRKLGDLYGYYEGSKPVLMIAKPDLIKEILKNDLKCFGIRRVFDSGDPILDNMLSVISGDKWKRIRSIVNHAFKTAKIKSLMNTFEEGSKTLLQNFMVESANTEGVDVSKFYAAFTMDVIALAAFSTKIDAHNNPENPFVKNAKKAFLQNLSIKSMLLLVMPEWLRKFGLRFLVPNSMHFFKNKTLDIIQERERLKKREDDVLQLLIDAVKGIKRDHKLEKADSISANYANEPKNDERNGEKKNDEEKNEERKNGESKNVVLNGATSSRLSMDELVAQSLVFFLGGYHTIATTLGLASYLLAVNPDVQEKMFDEISEVLNETEGELTYESIQKMKYMDKVIYEVLRMYPPNTRLERTAEADYKLGETGLIIPKGMIVAVSVFAMHRDKKFFPEPEIFDPERFEPEEIKQREFCYLPFGAGQRQCVGMRFSLIELKVCLAYVFSSFRMKICSKTQIPLEFVNGGGFLSPKSIDLLVVPRTKVPLKIK